MVYRFSLLFLLCLLFSNCNSSKKLIGLWQVEKVIIGENEMTPVARWTRFNKDQSQISGNGWLQHSIGSWNIDPKTNALSIINTNGIADDFEGFTWTIKEKKMIWERKEEGQKVKVILKQVKQIPTAPGNHLFGLWQQVNGDQKALYHFRWDNIVIKQNKAESKKYGSFRIHGHKNELECIFFTEPLKTERWTFKIKNDKMIEFIPLGGEAQSSISFKRINQFPDE